MKTVKKIGIAVCWIIVWQLAALIIHNKILLAGPLESAAALINMAKTPDFTASVITSVAHIALGIIFGAVLGIILGALSLKVKIIGEFLSPIVTVIKSVPVASFVVLVLIWIGSDNLSTVIVTLVVFPIIYLATIGGLTAADIKLLEMAHVYRMPASNKIRFIYIPALIPSYLGAFSTAVGMGFKSGAAAEVIGQPLLTMGNGLYRSKINLDTAEVFAWTFAIVLASWLTEKVFYLLIRLGRKIFVPGASDKDKNICKEAQNDN
ncbi:ABC transporter permease [Butyrivibrio sp. AE3004]|uniref:ABC transporter permease n=1 Tax=Butyrivibrio sp. AE3004 TaxID=1506994 RepID=UPI00068B7609|nr:ABC transporter permease subunit [Butyrivibrio sp. AE3004]